MDAASYLSSVIEIAIGIAGFAGIVAAIRQRSLSTWPPDQLIMLQVLFFASAAAILLSLMPAILTESGLSDAATWTISSCALTAWLVFATTYRALQSRAAGVRLPLPPPLLGLAVLIVALQIYNVIGAPTAWPFLAGLIGLIANGFAMFLMLLLRPRDEEA